MSAATADHRRREFDGTQDRRADAGPIAALCALPFILFGDLLFGHVLVGRDAAAYNLWMKQVFRELWLSGHLPLWDRLFSAPSFRRMWLFRE